MKITLSLLLFFLFSPILLQAQDSLLLDSEWKSFLTSLRLRTETSKILVLDIQKVATKEQKEALSFHQSFSLLYEAMKKDTFCISANVQEIQRLNVDLTKTLIRLIVISENYPVLRTQENYLDNMVALEGSENRLSIAKRKYNNYVLAANRKELHFGNVEEGTKEQTPAVKF